MPAALLNRSSASPTLPGEIVPAATFARSFTDPPANSQAAAWTGSPGTYSRVYVVGLGALQASEFTKPPTLGWGSSLIRGAGRSG